MDAKPRIDKDTFIEILQDKPLLDADDLLIFQTIYSLEKQEASATDLARIIGWKDKAAVVGRIAGLGMRILKKYDIKQSVRSDGSKRYWDFFFSGYYKGDFFIWKLKPELKEALEECGLVASIRPISLQRAFLFAWNPDNWDWKDLNENIEELYKTGKATQKWSCKSHKSVRPGDRAFIVKLGTNPKGIFASGKVVSEPFLSQHWSGEDKLVPRVVIEFDILLNPEKDPILLLDNLKAGNLKNQTWTPQASGISIKPEVLGELEEEWFEFLRNQNISHNPFIENKDLLQTYLEGSVAQVTQTRYERNIHARTECLKHFGYSCLVCDFNFEKHYGNIGYQFIHVHHLTQISSVGKEYKVNPIDDLRPVCPNCHAMLHKQNPPLSIEELKDLIKNK